MKYIILLMLAANDCGIPPIPPIPPIGTSECVPVCVCNSRGDNCHFEFQCE